MTARNTVRIGEGLPLVGSIAFGLIDRGTNLIQVRPSTACGLSCLFCSTNAGPGSKLRQTEYIVPPDLMLEGFRDLAGFKGAGVEAHIDTVGDPFTYPHLVELVKGIRETPGVEVISIQTHGPLLTEKVLDELSEAGLDRVNLSMDSVETAGAAELSGTPGYDVGRVIEMARYILERTKIDLLLAPVWVPGLNDEQMPRLIELAKELRAGKRWPPMGIQKCEPHKHGRKARGAKLISWWKFYNQLDAWEKEHGMKLHLHARDFGIRKAGTLPLPYALGERVKVRVTAPGWLKHEMLAVPPREDRTITVMDADRVPMGSSVTVKIVANKHNIYMGEIVG